MNKGINIADFKALCEQNNFTYPEEEVKAIGKKKKYVALILQELTDMWPKYLKDNTVKINENLSHIDMENIPILTDRYAIFVEAFIHTACNIYDCILYMINIIFLNSKLKSRSVNAENVVKELQNAGYNIIKEKLNEITVLKEYKYFHDFNIFTKHRGIVTANFSIAAKVGEKTRIGGKIKAFRLNDSEYEEMWVDDVIAMYSVIYDYYGELMYLLNSELKEVK